jgi:hypothetical protein
MSSNGSPSSSSAGSSPPAQLGIEGGAFNLPLYGNHAETNPRSNCAAEAAIYAGSSNAPQYGNNSFYATLLAQAQALQALSQSQPTHQTPKPPAHQTQIPPQVAFHLLQAIRALNQSQSTRPQQLGAVPPQLGAVPPQMGGAVSLQGNSNGLPQNSLLSAQVQAAALSAGSQPASQHPLGIGML